MDVVGDMLLELIFLFQQNITYACKNFEKYLALDFNDRKQCSILRLGWE